MWYVSRNGNLNLVVLSLDSTQLAREWAWRGYYYKLQAHKICGRHTRCAGTTGCISATKDTASD